MPPRRRPPWAGMVILPDVRGLHPYYEDLTMRFAEAGFTTIAIDYFGRSAGLGKRDDSFDWKSHFQTVTPEGVAHDVRAAVERLRADAKDPKFPIFTVGFCFGGANSWRQSGEGHGLAGCIGFYGGKPMDRAGPAIPKMTAPLLMLLAGADQGTPAGRVRRFRHAGQGAGSRGRIPHLSGRAPQLLRPHFRRAPRGLPGLVEANPRVHRPALRPDVMRLAKSAGVGALSIATTIRGEGIKNLGIELAVGRDYQEFVN